MKNMIRIACVLALVTLIPRASFTQNQPCAGVQAPVAPIAIAGHVVALPNLGVWNAVCTEAAATGNTLFGPTSAQASVELDAKQRLSAALAELRQKQPDVYQDLMTRWGLRLDDDQF